MRSVAETISCLTLTGKILVIDYMAVTDQMVIVIDSAVEDSDANAASIDA